MNEQNKMISVCVYCDSTDLYTEEEIMQDNLCDLDFPEYIVRAWYEKDKRGHDEETIDWTGCALCDCTFERWYDDAYTADSTDGLFDWAINNYGFHAQRWTPEQEEQA